MNRLPIPMDDDEEQDSLTIPDELENGELHTGVCCVCGRRAEAWTPLAAQPTFYIHQRCFLEMDES